MYTVHCSATCHNTISPRASRHCHSRQVSTLDADSHALLPKEMRCTPVLLCLLSWDHRGSKARIKRMSAGMPCRRSNERPPFSPSSHSKSAPLIYDTDLAARPRTKSSSTFGMLRNNCLWDVLTLCVYAFSGPNASFVLQVACKLHPDRTL